MKCKTKRVLSWVFAVLALFFETTYAIVLAEPFSNLEALWSWLILLAYLGHICSLIFVKRKFSFAVGLASAVLFLVGALVCDLEFWLVGVIMAGLISISVVLRK